MHFHNSTYVENEGIDKSKSFDVLWLVCFKRIRQKLNAKIGGNKEQNNINILNLFCLVVDLYESINFNELLFFG